MESPFDVLRIDADADEGEIHSAYRKRVLETHPDQGGSSEEFQAVKMAYEALTSGEPLADAYPDDDTRSGPPDARNPETGGFRRHADGRDQHDGSRVEYLNYEVLDDFGWSLDDDDLFEKAAAQDLDPGDRGRFQVLPHESLLEAAENRGFAWPFACRGGACANCAVAVTEGELGMPVDTVLPSEMKERGIRLSCNGVPETDEMKVVFNIKDRPGLEELRLPPHRFVQAHFND
ncbi:MAG: ferredoxin Fer [Halobacteriota archaeon]